ncbi:MAG: hypothetical protein HYS13_22005 [Planctomycetia bacterium]|nr:hypothetical protein [Planctomycetia bacterium]
MKHRATRRFWACYRRLPKEVQRLADAGYQRLLQDPRHHSLHLKKVGVFWSVRVGLHFRALAVKRRRDLVWFWIGTHAEYDKILHYE